MKEQTIYEYKMKKLFSILFTLILMGFALKAQNIMYDHNPSAEKIVAKKVGSDTFHKDKISNQTTVTDIDGNVYNTLTYGTQTWMVENLKTTKYNDGTAIPLVIDEESWAKRFTPAYCWFENNEASYKNWYGALYNWYVVSTSKLCPEGWHVPTDSEWRELIIYLRIYNYDNSTTKNHMAKAMAATTGWQSSLNEGAVGNTDYPLKRNVSRFTATPGGSRYDGRFNGWSSYTNWWTATEYRESQKQFVYFYQINYHDWAIYRHHIRTKSRGFSVRCVRD